MFQYLVKSTNGPSGDANADFVMEGSDKAHLEIVSEARRRHGANAFVHHYHRL